MNSPWAFVWRCWLLVAVLSAISGVWWSAALALALTAVAFYLTHPE